jgi:hypothetical protein
MTSKAIAGGSCTRSRRIFVRVLDWMPRLSEDLEQDFKRELIAFE